MRYEKHGYSWLGSCLLCCQFRLSSSFVASLLLEVFREINNGEEVNSALTAIRQAVTECERLKDELLSAEDIDGRLHDIVEGATTEALGLSRAI